jgi:two-component system chemotaxis response regulator CheY
MKMLSVDDSPAQRHIIRAAIELLGFEIIEAGDGKEALELLRQGVVVDLILLDWNMPVMNGIDMLRELKADEQLKHIPVVMVTSEAERHSMIEAIRCGAATYVLKPFTREDLLTKIMQSLNMSV